MKQKFPKLSAIQLSHLSL